MARPPDPAQIADTLTNVTNKPAPGWANRLGGFGIAAAVLYGLYDLLGRALNEIAVPITQALVGLISKCSGVVGALALALVVVGCATASGGNANLDPCAPWRILYTGDALLYTGATTLQSLEPTEERAKRIVRYQVALAGIELGSRVAGCPLSNTVTLPRIAYEMAKDEPDGWRQPGDPPLGPPLDPPLD